MHGSIEHMAETLDVLIDGAVEQTEHETESSQALQKVATQMHEREVSLTTCSGADLQVYEG